MSIISGTISISGFEQIDEVLELEVLEKPGQHPRARFRAGITEGTDTTIFYTYDQERTVTITGTDVDLGNRVVLFTGYIEDLKIHHMGADYYEIEVDLLGTSCKLDQDKRNRSFQDVSMTHEGVMKKASSSTSGCSITWNGSPARPIGMPVIQYMETDWEFILRMASIYNKNVFANVSAEYPLLSIGMELSSSGVELKEHFYRVGVSKRFYELGGKRAGLIKKNFQYYQVTSRLKADMGQYVTFLGMQLVVCEKITRLSESEIRYTYRLSTQDYGSAKTIYNQSFIGRTILGNVIETKGETLKLDLELSDDDHDNSVAYPYNWTPETGNIMYCMPKAGTKVSLYFGDEEESSATVVNCVRTNGATCGKMGNPSNKHFTSEDGLAMDLNLDDMHFATAEDPKGNAFSRFFLLDDKSITFETVGTINVVANQSLNIDAKMIFMGAANGEVVFVGTLGSTKASFYLHYQFDALGRKTGLSASLTSSMPRINDDPLAAKPVPKEPETKKEEKNGWSLGLFGKMAAGFAAAVVATAAVCLIATGVGAGAGVVLGIAAAGIVSGAFAVGAMGVEEANAKKGDTKSLGQYVGNGFVQGLIGAASTAIGGPVSSTVGKFAIEMGATTISTVAGNAITGKELTDGLGLSLVISAVTFGVFDTNLTKRIPGLNRFSSAAESASEQADNAIGKVKDAWRTVRTQSNEVAASKAAKEEAKGLAEQAAREEAEKAAKEQAARSAERAAKQARNAIRNQGGRRAAKQEANAAVTAAKQARKAAVNEHTVARAASQSAQNALETATSNQIAKEAAKKATTRAFGRASVPAMIYPLSYNFVKSTVQNEMNEAAEDEENKKYLEGVMDYIEEQFSGLEIWTEE